MSRKREARLKAEQRRKKSNDMLVTIARSWAEYKEKEPKPQDIVEVTCDTIARLGYWEKQKALAQRADWLRRQRENDRIMLRRQEVRQEKASFIRRGICPACRKHELLDKEYKMCLLCRIRKSQRTKQLRILGKVFGRCKKCHLLRIPKGATDKVKVGQKCVCRKR